MKSSTQIRGWEKLLWPVVTVGLVLLSWHYLVLWSATKVFPSPLDVSKGLGGLLRKHLLWADIVDSLRRVGLGFGAAVILGVPIGLTLGWYPAVNQVVNPTIQLLRPISPIAWIPVAIILFGVGEPPAVFLIFLSAFFPVVVACINGVNTVSSTYRRAGRNLGLTQVQILRKVIFPAALPQIIVGLRIALGVSWLVVVAGEMIAVDSGLGYLVIDSRNSGKHYDLVVAAMLVIGLIGLALDMCFRQIQKIKSVRWGFRYDH